MSTLDDAIQAVGPPPQGADSSSLDQAVSNVLSGNVPSDNPQSASIQNAPQPKFTPSQLLDPANVAAINKAYGLHRPGSEAIAKVGQWIANAPQKAGDFVQNLAVKAGANPWGAAAAGEGTQLGLQALEAAPFGGVGGTTRGAADARILAPATTPYAASEEAEISRLGDLHARAADKGLQIPEQGTSETLSKAAGNNQPIVDSAVKENFGLSPKAPATPQMLENWRKDFAANSTYAEARAVPKVQLNDDAIEGLSNLPKPLYDRLEIDSKISPSGSIKGNDVVDVSQALRARSTQLWKTSKMFPEYQDQAIAMDRTIDSLEDSVTPKLKNPEQWSLDRAKIAQSYDAQSALDGGHFDARDLARLKFAKNQIKPWTGDMSDIADLAQLHPDAFQLTRTAAPQYSWFRKGVAMGAGALAAQGAAKLGGGAISHLVGQGTANTITPP